MANLTIVVNDLAITVKAANNGDRDTQQPLTGGRRTFVGESPHPPLVHLESSSSLSEDDDFNQYETEIESIVIDKIIAIEWILESNHRLEYMVIEEVEVEVVV